MLSKVWKMRIKCFLLFKCTSLDETCFLFRTMVLGHELPPEQLLVWVEAVTRIVLKLVFCKKGLKRGKKCENVI